MSLVFFFFSSFYTREPHTGWSGCVWRDLVFVSVLMVLMTYVAALKGFSVIERS